jgi:hypothetical protein
LFPVRKAFPPLACLHEQFDQRSIDLVVNACTAGFHEPHGHARSLQTNLAVERKLCLVMFAQRVRENSAQLVGRDRQCNPLGTRF